MSGQAQVGLRRDGFTLLEMLFVIAILAVLIALLLPTITRARSQARTVVCASNLRQVYAASQVWKVRHDAAALAAPGWRVTFRPFLNSAAVYRCPEDQGPEADDLAPTSGTPGTGGTPGSPGNAGTGGTPPSTESLIIRVRPAENPSGAYRNYPDFDIPFAPGPWAQVRNQSGNSYELWVENLGFIGGGDRDFNDIRFSVKDNGDGTMTVTNMGGSTASTPADLVNGDTGDTIWRHCNVPGGTPAGATVTVGNQGTDPVLGNGTGGTTGTSGTAGTTGSGSPSSYGLSNQVNWIYGNSDRVFGIDYLFSVTDPFGDSWSSDRNPDGSYKYLAPDGRHFTFARHSGGVNVLYGDGSVRWLHLTAANLDPALATNRTQYWVAPN